MIWLFFFNHCNFFLETKSTFNIVNDKKKNNHKMVAMINSNNNNNYSKGKIAKDWPFSQTHKYGSDHIHKPEWHSSLCGMGIPIIFFLAWSVSVVVVTANWHFSAAGTLLVTLLLCSAPAQGWCHPTFHTPAQVMRCCLKARPGKCVWSPLQYHMEVYGSPL